MLLIYYSLRITFRLSLRKSVS